LNWDDVKIKTAQSNMPIGSGIIPEYVETIVNKDKKYKIKDIDMFYPTTFLKLNKDLTNIIYVPMNFRNSYITKNLLNINNNLSVKTLQKKDYPLSLLDLKSTIMFKSIESTHDLSIRIKNFNYNIVKRLEKLY
jgi:hypothetical protein